MEATPTSAAVAVAVEARVLKASLAAGAAGVADLEAAAAEGT